MKKILSLIILIVVVLSGCASKTVSSSIISPEQRQVKYITSGEIMNLSEVDGKYIVTITQYDESNQCNWINKCEVSKEEFQNLKLDQQYTFNNIR